MATLRESSSLKIVIRKKREKRFLQLKLKEIYKTCINCNLFNLNIIKNFVKNILPLFLILFLSFVRLIRAPISKYFKEVPGTPGYKSATFTVLEGPWASLI